MQSTSQGDRVIAAPMHRNVDGSRSRSVCRDSPRAFVCVGAAAVPVTAIPSRNSRYLPTHKSEGTDAMPTAVLLPMAPPLVVLLLASLALALRPVRSHGGGGSFDPARVTQLSWRPRAFLYSGFLSDSECDHLVKLAKGGLEKSLVADNGSGRSITSQVRTSSGTFLAKRQDDIVSAIEERVAAWTFLPEENAESIQVLRYETGQKYDAHFDYFHDKVNLWRGGHRAATVLMYLSDVKKGGETVFPKAVGGHLQYKDETWSDCSKAGLAVKPKKGDALLFFSLHVNATTDRSSLHGGCPVIEGEKWSATKWIHVRSFDNPPNVRPCSDDNDHCPRWAAIGECYKNPTFMVGTKDTPGFCRKSCGVCDA